MFVNARLLEHGVDIDGEQVLARMSRFDEVSGQLPGLSIHQFKLNKLIELIDSISLVSAPAHDSGTISLGQKVRVGWG